MQAQDLPSLRVFVCVCLCVCVCVCVFVAALWETAAACDSAAAAAGPSSGVSALVGRAAQVECAAVVALEPFWRIFSCCSCTVIDNIFYDY